MTPERFARLLAVYGARPERWPDAERLSALDLAASQEDSVGAAESLDTALDRFVVPRPDSAMLGRALAGFAAQRPRSLLRRWWFAPLLASAGALGVAAGALLLSAMPGERHTGWFDENPSIFSDAPGDSTDPNEVSL